MSEKCDCSKESWALQTWKSILMLICVSAICWAGQGIKESNETSIRHTEQLAAANRELSRIAELLTNHMTITEGRTRQIEATIHDLDKRMTSMETSIHRRQP